MVKGRLIGCGGYSHASFSRFNICSTKCSRVPALPG